MKRGQIAILLVLIVAVLLITGFMIYQMSKQSITGQAVSNTRQRVSNTETTQEQETEIPEINYKCQISPPRSCKIGSMSEEYNELILQRGNIRSEDLVIREVFVSECERTRKDQFLLEVGAARSLTFNCPIKEKENFGERIEITYKEESGSETKTLTGTLIEKV